MHVCYTKCNIKLYPKSIYIYGLSTVDVGRFTDSESLFSRHAISVGGSDSDGSMHSPPLQKQPEQRRRLRRFATRRERHGGRNGTRRSALNAPHSTGPGRRAAPAAAVLLPRPAPPALAADSDAAAAGLLLAGDAAAAACVAPSADLRAAPPAPRAAAPPGSRSDEARRSAVGLAAAVIMAGPVFSGSRTAALVRVAPLTPGWAGDGPARSLSGPARYPPPTRRGGGAGLPGAGGGAAGARGAGGGGGSWWKG